jgi:hypothetical protein
MQLFFIDFYLFYLLSGISLKKCWYYNPAVTITVFTTILEQNRYNSRQISAKLSEVNVKNTLRHTLIKKIFLTFLLTPYPYTFSQYENPSFIKNTLTLHNNL